jgi:hypothetical protein
MPKGRDRGRRGRHRRERGESRQVQRVTQQCAQCLADPPVHHYGVRKRRCKCGCASVPPPGQ